MPLRTSQQIFLDETPICTLARQQQLRPLLAAHPSFKHGRARGDKEDGFARGSALIASCMLRQPPGWFPNC